MVRIFLFFVPCARAFFALYILISLDRLSWWLPYYFEIRYKKTFRPACRLEGVFLTLRNKEFGEIVQSDWFVDVSCEKYLASSEIIYIQILNLTRNVHVADLGVREIIDKITQKKKTFGLELIMVAF